MIHILLLLALHAPQETPADEARRLGKDPKANRDAILRLGPGAIRPLLEVRSDDLEPILRELRFGGDAASRTAKAKLEEGRVTLELKDVALWSALEGVMESVPEILLDPSLYGTAGAKLVSISVKGAPAGDALGRLCAAGNLDYRLVRGRILVSTPDRLWSPPAERPKALAEGDAAKLKELIAELDSDSLDARDGAAAAILKYGASAAPHLEAEAARGGLERQGRLRDLAAKLVTRAAPPGFPAKMAFESAELDAGSRAAAKTLEEGSCQIRVREVAVPKALKILLSQVMMNAEFRGAEEDRASLFFSGSYTDLLYFLTAPFGLDAELKDGRLLVDRRENLGKKR